MTAGVAGFITSLLKCGIRLPRCVLFTCKFDSVSEKDRIGDACLRPSKTGLHRGGQESRTKLQSAGYDGHPACQTADTLELLTE